eukprot:gene13184-30644_t
MEYMAPEIISGSGHDKSVDWWSTGILLYEMLCGVPPFRAKSRQALQNHIVQTKVKFPKFLSTPALNILKGMLQKDATKRLGFGPDGSEAIKQHPFFKSINWGKLERREVGGGGGVLLNWGLASDRTGSAIQSSSTLFQSITGGKLANARRTDGSAAIKHQSQPFLSSRAINLGQADAEE